MTDVWNDAKTVMRELALDNINIITDKPPILSNNDEENEIKDLFGDEYDDHTIEEKVDPADFTYISEMLKMVKNHDDNNSMPSPKNGSDKTEGNSNLYVVSKLNPNVPEFVSEFKVPEKQITTTSMTIDVKPTINNINENEIPNLPTKPSLEETLPKIDINNISTDEAVILKEKFKSVIKDNSEMTIRKKKRRNVAIANILKLNVVISQSKLPVQNEPMMENALKLMTPDDFMRSSNATVTPQKPVEVEPTMEQISSSSLESKLDEINESLEKININDKPTISKPKMVKKLEEPSPEELQQSISKVESWFNNESSLDSSNRSSETELNNVKKRSPRRVLSPINIVTHPPKTASSPSNENINANQVKKFVPKNKGLYKKYLEKSKAKVERSEDIWDRVQRQMKEKEKLMQSKNGSVPSEN